MYFKSGKEFCDYDFYLLTEMLEHLDVKVKKINSDISLSADPDTDGLFDKGEYYIGVGFSLIQRYISSTYPKSNIKKSDALELGEKIKSNLSYIKVINAGANYWKHEDEWGLMSSITKDVNSLKDAAKNTINTIELLTPWASYTCSNLLAALVGENEFVLSSLLPYLESWRYELDSKHGERK